MKQAREALLAGKPVPNELYDQLVGNSACFGALQQFGAVTVEYDHEIS